MHFKVGISILLLVLGALAWSYVSRPKGDTPTLIRANYPTPELPLVQARAPTQHAQTVETPPGYVTDFQAASKVLPVEVEVDRQLQTHPSMYQMAWTADGTNPMLVAAQHPPQINFT